MAGTPRSGSYGTRGYPGHQSHPGPQTRQQEISMNPRALAVAGNATALPPARSSSTTLHPQVSHLASLCLYSLLSLWSPQSYFNYGQLPNSFVSRVSRRIFVPQFPGGLDREEFHCQYIYSMLSSVPVHLIFLIFFHIMPLTGFP